MEQMPDNSIGADTDVNAWRANVVAASRRVLIWGGLFPVAVSVWWGLQNGDERSAAIVSATYLALATAMLWPGRSIAFRASVLVLLCAASGIAQLLIDASHGAGYQISLAAAVLAGLLFCRKAAFWWVTLIIAAVALTTGLYGLRIIQSSDPAVGGLLWWLSWSTSFAVIAVALTLIQQYISAHLIQSLDQSRRARTELAKASSAKDELLSMVSHELRTPLTPVMLSLGALKNDPLLPEDVRQEIAIAYENITLEAQLIGDLLDLTDIVCSQFVLHRSGQDLHAIVRDALEQYRLRFVRAKLDVTVDLKACSTIAQADAPRLTQVMRHLLDNAAKFSPSGGQLLISSSNHQRQGATWLRLDLHDTGVGIVPESAGQLFGVFEQADRARTRRFGGMGLGLPICKEIVELHGGLISVASDGPDKGCTVTIELPVDATPVVAKSPRIPNPES